MLNQSARFNKAIQASTRDIRSRVTVNGIVYDDSKISSIQADLGSISGEEYTIGSAVTNSVTVVFSDIVNTIAPLDRVVVEIGIVHSEFAETAELEQMKVGTAEVGDAKLYPLSYTSGIEYVQIGVFYISDHVNVDYNEKKTTFTCQDEMIYLEGVYESSLAYPIDSRQVVTEIANQAGVVIDTANIKSLSGTLIQEPIGYTHKQALGLIAQIETGFVHFNHAGKLQIKTLVDVGYTINMDNYYSKGLQKNGIRYRVGGINCVVNTDDEAVTLHSGQVIGPQINIESNIMTQAILDSIYNKLKAVDFYPYDLEWRGNPALEVGDIVTVLDDSGTPIKVPNLTYQLSYNGGLKATSQAEMKSRPDVKVSGRKTLQQQIDGTYQAIKKESRTLLGVFEEAQQKITGNQGGHVVTRLDADDKPYEILVMDTEDINSASNVIRLNQQGLGFSQFGYNGPFGVAITIDGQIVADYITAGTLSSVLIEGVENPDYNYWNLTNGDFGVGNADSYMQFSPGNTMLQIKDVLSGDFTNISAGEVRNYSANLDDFAILGKGRIQFYGNDMSLAILGNTLHGENWVNEGTLQVQHNQRFAWGRYNDYTTTNPNAMLDAYLALEYAEPNVEDTGYIRAYKEMRFNKDIYLSNGGFIRNAYEYGLQHGGRIYSVSTDSQFRIEGSTGISLRPYGIEKMRVDDTRVYMYQPLNMQDNPILQQSDARLKENVISANTRDSLGRINQLDFKYFDLINTNRVKRKNQLGVIAQEVQKFAPEWVIDDGDYLSLDMFRMLMEAMKATQQLSRKRDADKEKINKLITDVKLLKDQINGVI